MTNMKSSGTKENGGDGEYQIISEGLGISADLVRKICYGIRKDHHNVLKAMQMLRNHKALSREQLLRKLSRLKPKVSEQ
jgi:hypothetical protein